MKGDTVFISLLKLSPGYAFLISDELALFCTQPEQYFLEVFILEFMKITHAFS